MRRIGWVVVSFYVLTACLVIAMTVSDSPVVDRISGGEPDPQAQLQSYCNEWPTHAECLVLSASAKDD